MPEPRVLLWALLLGAAAAGAVPINDRMTLVEAIEAVRESGIDVVYSTELVEAWMLVREAPAEDDPVAALQAALAAYSLALNEGPGGKWLVVQGDAVPRESVLVSSAPETGPVVVEAPRIEEITIVGSRHGMFDRRGVADQFLDGEEIRQMPHIADDAFRALHRLPGVAASDFQAPFNLRGGTVDEVKVQIDGLEIVEPFHMRTLYQPLSIIDPGIIAEAQVLSGGFTAEHGNYASGVIDISTRQPDGPPVHELGVSFVSAFARSGGQFNDGRSSYFVSVRRGYLDLVTDEVVDQGEELKPRYADLFGRVSHAVGDRTDLSLQVLLAQDDVTFIDPLDGGNVQEDTAMQYAWINLDFEPVPGVLSSTKLFSGHIDSTEDGSQLQLPTEDITRYFDIESRQAGVQTDWVVPIGNRHLVRLGARYRQMKSDYVYFLDSMRRSDFVNNSAPYFVNRDIRLRAEGDDLGAYAAYRARVSDRWYWEFGLRWDSQDWGDVSEDSQLSPRVNALYELADRTDLRFAWGKFYQPQAIHDLLIADGDIQFHEPIESDHVAVGIRHTFESGVELQADVYDKRYHSVLPRYESLLDIYEYAPEANFDRARIQANSARAFGAELTLSSRNEGAVGWWLSYTWSKVQDDIDGQDVYRSWDQRHALSASVTWHGEKWTISAVGRYHSGWPRTPLFVSPVYDNAGNIIGVDADLSQWNSERFDSYSRIDLRASREVTLTRGRFEYYFEIYNLFDTENPCCTSNHRLSFAPSPSVSPVFENYLPLFPSFGFVWTFGPGS